MVDHYHLVGIGGIGMSALAEWLLTEGHTVSGTDLSFSDITKRLEARGAKIAYAHTKEGITPQTKVVYSSGIPPENTELETAHQLGCPLFHRSELIEKLVEPSRLLVVTGAHGKTSTTAMLAEVLEEAEWDPSVLLGGISNRFGVNGKRGQGEWVVLEGDESDGSFLRGQPDGAIVTNFDREHLKYWKTEGELLKAFRLFAEQVKDENLLFFCGDDPILSTHYTKGFSYGFSPSNDLIISNLHQEGWNLRFDLTFEGDTYKKVVLRHIGKHQALNGAAVFGLALKLGIKESQIRSALASFSGVKRRVDKKGENNGILFLDDYGHHPTEIAATIKGIKTAFPARRLVVAFQPHRYSRTAECLPLFGKAFEGADLLVLSDIYGAGEKPIPGITGESILQQIQQQSKVVVHYVVRDKIKEKLDGWLLPNDICISMGAGDITHLFSTF